MIERHRKKEEEEGGEEVIAKIQNKGQMNK